MDAPLTMYCCPDGVLRVFGHVRGVRNPLYCWDLDPDNGFALIQRREIFDVYKAKLPIRPESWPKVDMCKLLPPTGRTQVVVHRVSTRAFNLPYPKRPNIAVINKGSIVVNEPMKQLLESRGHAKLEQIYLDLIAGENK